MEMSGAIIMRQADFVQSSHREAVTPYTQRLAQAATYIQATYQQLLWNLLTKQFPSCFVVFNLTTSGLPQTFNYTESHVILCLGNSNQNDH